MIKNHPGECGLKDRQILISESTPQKKEPTPFTKYKITGDLVIDEMLHTLREEENAAHE